MQNNTYPGLDGIESLDLGHEGAITTVTGRLYGTTAADLQAAMTDLWNLWDGLTYDFEDALGTTWPEVKIESISWLDRGQVDPALGFTRRYSCRLLHLTLS